MNWQRIQTVRETNENPYVPKTDNILQGSCGCAQREKYGIIELTYLRWFQRPRPVQTDTVPIPLQPHDNAMVNTGQSAVY